MEPKGENGASLLKFSAGRHLEASPLLVRRLNNCALSRPVSPVYRGISSIEICQMALCSTSGQSRV